MLALGIAIPPMALGAEPPGPRAEYSWTANSIGLAAADAGADAVKPAIEFPADVAVRKSYSIPALEIVGFDLLLNLHNRHLLHASRPGRLRQCGTALSPAI